ncbi:hypothetical protein Vretifemale_20878, partial [Volvox reticuliferus]
GVGWARDLSVVFRNDAAVASAGAGPGVGDFTTTSVELLNRASWFQSIGGPGGVDRRGSRDCGIGRDSSGKGGGLGGGGGGTSGSWHQRPDLSEGPAAAGADSQDVGSHQSPELKLPLSLPPTPAAAAAAPPPPPPPPMRVLRFGDANGANSDGGRPAPATVIIPSDPSSRLSQSAFAAGVGQGGDDSRDGGDGHSSTSITAAETSDIGQRRPKAVPLLVLPSVR